MGSAVALGGDDPNHDLSPDEKDKLEKDLRKQARKLLSLRDMDMKERKKLLDRATEISRKKSKKAHQDGD